jgi:mevalonate kinase
VGETNGKHFMENLKDKGFHDVKNQFVKYTDLCRNFLGGDMKSLFLNTKNYPVVLSNFKPMIPSNLCDKRN